MQGDKDRCNLMVNPQGSDISRWLVDEGGEVGFFGGRAMSNQQRGIAAPHLLFFCTPCPQQSASPTTPTASPNTPAIPPDCAVSVKKSVLLQQSPGTSTPPHQSSQFLS